MAPKHRDHRTTAKRSNQEATLMNNQERQLMYNQHRLRVQNANSVVDSQAPQRSPKTEAMRRELSFIELLASLQAVGALHRTNEYRRTFTKPPMQQRRALTEKRSDSLASMLSVVEQKQFSYAIPEHVLQHYECFGPKCSGETLRKLLRPRIFLDLEVKNVRPLGRLVIQLFTEACPEVVMEFVRVCMAQHHERFSVTRLITPLWFEGELSLHDSKALRTNAMEHDLYTLDHGCGAGVLSFPSRYVRGCKRRFLSFSISFQPLNVLNGKRIAFGRVRRGNWILDAIQDHGTKNDRPVKEIIITKCGILK